MQKKIRYAVVGAGWISQEAFLPAIALTENSALGAIVSGSAGNAKKLAEFHGGAQVVAYADYDALLASGSVDAVYVALPNSMHADYTIRALKAGLPVMVEKPLASTLAESEAMVAAAKEAGVPLMTAYRLHNEPGTQTMLNAIHSGQIGRPLHFSSTFSFQMADGNHRLNPEHWGGPLQDVGVYCLNAARHVFQAEPTQVQAMASHPINDPRFARVESSLTVTLRFGPDQTAQFFCSFGAHLSEQIRVVGSAGDLTLDPAYRFETAMKLRVNSAKGQWSRDFPHVDHFAGQLAYFSDCILNSDLPEANGSEGLADMVALLAIEEAAKTGRTIDLPARPFASTGIKPAMMRAYPLTKRRLLL